MKRILLSISIFAFWLAAIASPLSPVEALSRVKSSHLKKAGLNQHVNTVPVAEIKAQGATAPGVYIFESGNDGYLIVSADDSAVPLLGYSDTQKFDADNVPPQLQYWLDFYAEEIAYTNKKGTKMVRSLENRPSRAPIEPMIKTKWDQEEPYNLDCPEMNGQRSYTGCVATAMAQAMYYHQWPPKGTGQHSYNWNGKTLSQNFASQTYDWTNMSLTYDANSSEKSKSAVAQLMYSCGVAVDMNYSPYGSGAGSLKIAPALYNYFGYDKSMFSAIRNYYTPMEWENLIYDQLAKKQVVIYGGNGNYGGHEFLCDGYSSDGYFHFNWGWGGLSDGYFLLSALNPYDKGAGGGAPGEGFNIMQEVVLNMKPAEANSKPTPMIIAYGNLTPGVPDESGYFVHVDWQTQIKAGTLLGLFCSYENLSCCSLDIKMGIKVTKWDIETMKEDPSFTPLYIEDTQGGFQTIEVMNEAASPIIKLPQLPDGFYRFSPYCLVKGDNTPVEIRSSSSSYGLVIGMVSKNQYNIFSSGFVPGLTEFKVNTPLYIGKGFETEFTLTNTSDQLEYLEYNIDIYKLENIEGEQFWNYCNSTEVSAVELAPGEKRTIKHYATVPTMGYFYNENLERQYTDFKPGNYLFVLSNYFTGSILYPEDNENFLNELRQVKVAPTVTKATATIELAKGGTDIKGDKAVFNVKVNCTEGYYNQPVVVVLWDFNDEENPTLLTQTSSDVLCAVPGETLSVNVPVDISNIEIGTKIQAAVYIYEYNKESDSYDVIPTDYIMIEKKESGVEKDVLSDFTCEIIDNSVLLKSEGAITQAIIYNLSGLALKDVVSSTSNELSFSIADLPKGVYILKALDKDGNTLQKRFIR